MRMLVVVVGVDLSLLERFGLIERGKKKCGRRFKVLWEFSSKTRTTRTVFRTITHWFVR